MRWVIINQYQLNFYSKDFLFLKKKNCANLNLYNLSIFKIEFG